MKELTAITETWLNSSNKVNQYISEQILSQKKRIMGVDQLTENSSSSRQKYIVFVKSSADDTKLSIPIVERPWLSEAEYFILPNHDTGRILPAKSQRNTTDPSVVVTDSSATNYDSADESSVCSTPLPPLKKLDGAEPISGSKTIKSILRSKSTFKVETLKGIIINEPSSAPAKGNKSSSTSKVNLAPAGKLKSVKIEDDSPLAIYDITKPIWYLDDGCSRNMTGVKSYLHKYVEQPGPKVVFGDDSTCTTKGYGSIKCNGIFDEKRVIIFNSNKEVVMIAPRHIRFAHLNFKTINKLAKQNLVIGFPSLVYSKDKPCSSCEKGKHHRASFKTNQTSSIKKYLHLLHMDLFGPVTPRSINHEKYTLVIVNEYSRSTIRKRIPRINFLHVFGCRVYIHNHKDHLGKFDEKADDGYLLGYSLVSKAFRVFNTRRQQTEETYHVTFDESPDAIKFSKPLVENINIAENERYPPDEYLHPYEPSQRYQTNSNDVSFIEPYECPELIVLETKVSSDQNGKTDQNDHNDQNDQSVQNDKILTGMLTRAMAKELGAASAIECLFVDFLSKEEPKKVSEALQHPG
ncbi:retrovirus-related pol polyprotein from transposon TNT 1-94 [Tanacetum coccineum]